MHFYRRRTPYTPDSPAHCRAIEAWLEELSAGGYTLERQGFLLASFRSTMPPKPLRYRMERNARRLETNQARRQALTDAGWQYVTLMQGFSIYSTTDLSHSALPPWADQPPSRNPYSLVDFFTRYLFPSLLAFCALALLVFWRYLFPSSSQALMATRSALFFDIVHISLLGLLLLVLLVLELRQRLRGRAGTLPPFLHSPAQEARARRILIARSLLIFFIILLPSLGRNWVDRDPILSLELPTISATLPLPAYDALDPTRELRARDSYFEQTPALHVLRARTLSQDLGRGHYSITRYDMKSEALAQSLQKAFCKNFSAAAPYESLPSDEATVLYQSTLPPFDSDNPNGSQRLLLQRGSVLFSLSYSGPLDLREHVAAFTPYFDKA